MKPLTIAGHRLICTACGKHYATEIYGRPVCGICATDMRAMDRHIFEYFKNGRPPGVMVVLEDQPETQGNGRNGECIILKE